MSGAQAPTAVLLCSDFLASGAYSAVSDLGLKIPTDVSIVSFDDFPLARHMDPPLTTFRQPLREMGAEAAGLLAEQFGNGNGGYATRKTRHELVPCPMITRASAGVSSRGKSL